MTESWDRGGDTGGYSGRRIWRSFSSSPGPWPRPPVRHPRDRRRGPGRRPDEPWTARGQGRGPDALAAALATDTVLPDSAFWSFGPDFPAAVPAGLDATNPHQVAQAAVALCRDGRTDRVLADFPQVEPDSAAGAALETFVEVFCSDLQQYRGCLLSLRFAGVRDGDGVSVWYYYLLDARGEVPPDSSWVSTHRSKRTGRVALTGIFLNSAGEVTRLPADIRMTR